MKQFVFCVGDVHGCLRTFEKLLRQWDARTQTLVQVGDIIDRGNFTPETIQFARTVEREYQSVFLKGNHEAEMIRFVTNLGNENWLRQGGKQTIEQYAQQPEMSLFNDYLWLRKRPLFVESQKVCISHAGFSDTEFPLNEENPRGVLWNRTSLRHIGKTQIIGHTPLKDGVPEFTETSCSWNIDTGAYKGRGLTAVVVECASGEVVEIYYEKTLRSDIS